MKLICEVPYGHIIIQFLLLFWLYFVSNHSVYTQTLCRVCVLFLGKCFYLIPKIKAEVTDANYVKDIMPDIIKYAIRDILG